MILVINGNGTTGSALLRELCERGGKVRALVRDLDKARANAPAGVELVGGDLGDPRGLAAAMVGVRAVYVATPACPELPQLEAGIGRACAQAGVQRIVKLGGVRVEDESMPPLMTKLHARGHAALCASGVPVVQLRANFYMQNFFMSAAGIREGAIHAPTGSGRASFVDARDVARCAAVVLTEPRHDDAHYDVTGPVALSFAEAAHIFAEQLHRGVQHVDVPAQAFAAVAVAAGAPEWVVARLVELYAHLQVSDWAAAPTDAVQRLTGRAPRGLAEFIDEHRGYFG